MIDIDDQTEKQKAIEDEKLRIYMQNCFRQWFRSAAGQEVLGYIMTQAGYFDTNLETTEELVVLNFVKRHILKNCGLLKIENVKPYVQKLFEIPVLGEQTDGR